jgi:hypothetical protein
MAATFAWLLTLSALGADPNPPKVTIEKLGDVFEFKTNGELVTKYHTQKSCSKPYLWPLLAPGGIALSRDWPMQPAKAGESTDHPHQRSAWFGYGDVFPEDVALTSKTPGVKGVDFWSEGLNHGKIKCISVEESELAKSLLRTHNSWQTADGQPLLDETREIRLVPLDGAHLIIVCIVLTSSGNVTFADTKEGALGVRVSDRLCLSKNAKSVILNSSGQRGDKECWGRKADWCDYSGAIDGKQCGITIFDDPKNRSRACWHVRAYGLLAANPFGRKEAGFPAHKDLPDPPVRLKPGEELRLRYGILLHTGTVDIKDHYRKFAAD